MFQAVARGQRHCGVSRVCVCVHGPCMLCTWGRCSGHCCCNCCFSCETADGTDQLWASPVSSLQAAARSLAIIQSHPNLLKCLALEPDANQQWPGLLLQFPGKPLLVLLARHAAAAESGRE